MSETLIKSVIFEYLKKGMAQRDIKAALKAKKIKVDKLTFESAVAEFRLWRLQLKVIDVVERSSNRWQRESKQKSKISRFKFGKFKNPPFRAYEV